MLSFVITAIGSATSPRLWSVQRNEADAAPLLDKNGAIHNPVSFRQGTKVLKSSVPAWRSSRALLLVGYEAKMRRAITTRMISFVPSRI